VSRPSLFVKIPKERIGVLIGPGGSVKETIERRLSVDLKIDSETGDVTITLNPDAENPAQLFKAKDVVIAIGRGFSPERAFRLIDDEETILDVIDLREEVGRSPSNLRRVKGRIIGKDGKTRRIIEELTEASVSVYGHTVAIIGKIEQARTAREAIQMLIQGSPHSTVYRFLHRERRKLKRMQLRLWETGEPPFP